MAVSEDALSIVHMMDKILDRVVGGFEQAGVELPERRFWKAGTPAADCEQLAVYFQQAYVGPPGDEAAVPQRCHSPRTAQVGVRVTRCIPTPIGPRGRMPEAEAIQESAHNQVIDAWVLLDIAAGLDTWNDDLGGPGLGVIATVDIGEPQGGFQSVILNLTVAIP